MAREQRVPAVWLRWSGSGGALPSAATDATDKPAELRLSQRAV